ncbi:MAG: VCBS repeat-containing protein [Deltaproteobacteria bacterium]|nr:VCBS repeat-containing protein [Deltaproteobacteria bacterium]
MRIASADIMMASARSFVEKDSMSENLEVWIGDRNPGAVARMQDSAVFSDKAMGRLDKDAQKVGGLEFEPVAGGSVYILKLLMEALTGKEIKVRDASKMDSKVEGIESESIETAKPAQADAAPQREGWGVIYNSTESHEEKEATSFTAKGVVRTSDGKEIDFSLRLVMQREFATTNTVDIRAGDALLKDPLVVNFNGEAAGLTDMRFKFDLNADGIKEDMPFVKQGSGFLVFDKNENGVIDNGQELFGPATNNGFSELSAYDADKNNWIDENDGIYSKLRLWTKDSSGTDSFYTLKDKGIGAIYLANNTTLFDLRDQTNSLDGRILASGVYLSENGDAGTIQQLDLVV